MTNKKVKQFLVQKYTEKWMAENKEFIADYQELCENLLMFHASWGVEIGLIFKNSNEVKGRELGVGIVEELFNAQEKTRDDILDPLPTNILDMEPTPETTPTEEEKAEVVAPTEAPAENVEAAEEKAENAEG